MSDLLKLESLPVETLAEMANEAAAACEASGRKTVEHAIRCGRALLAAKAVVPHGEWADWLSEHFEHSGRLARKYIEIANWHGRANLEDANSLGDALRIIADTPEKQAKKAEREARKAEAPPKPLAPATSAPPVTVGTIRHESPPTLQPQPERPAWLADPDDLERLESDDLPQLPRTNTHHTAENRREPDARETDRIGLVSPEDPRTLQDGRLYVWRESANRLFLATPDEIWEAAMEAIPDKLAAHSGAPTPEPRNTKKVVDRERDTKRFVRPTVAQVAAYATEIGAAIDPEQFCDFYASKDWMIGKNKMKDWKAAVRTWKRQQAGKTGSAENGKVRAANWEDDGTGWEDLRDG